MSTDQTEGQVRTKHQRREKQNEHKRKKEQGNLYNLDSSTHSVLWRKPLFCKEEKSYVYSCIRVTVSVPVIQKVRGGIIGWGTVLHFGSSQIRDPMREFNLPNSSSRTMSNRNEYQKQKRKCFGGVWRGGRVRLTTLPPSVSRLSDNVGSSTSSNAVGLHGLLRGIALFYCYIMWLREIGFVPQTTSALKLIQQKDSFY
jgi:hypothetical protein